jgi:hypothetical protein
MDTDSKAQILGQAARLEELIEQSTQIMEKTNALLDQSRRLVRQAQRHRLDGGRNHKPRHGALNAIESN